MSEPLLPSKIPGGNKDCLNAFIPLTIFLALGCVLILYAYLEYPRKDPIALLLMYNMFVIVYAITYCTARRTLYMELTRKDLEKLSFA
jgi:hypothetical protein